MSYKVRYDNDRPGEAPGPFTSGHSETLEEAKAHAEQLRRREGFHNFAVYRGPGLSEGELVSELIDGAWHDRSHTRPGGS
jgi:quinol monooxygenase YgiN